MDNKLYGRLISIGIQVSGKPLKNAEIESTLVDACYEVDNDSRLLSLLFAWITKYHGLVILSKFLKYYKTVARHRGKCPWVAALLIMSGKKSSLIQSFLKSDDFSCSYGTHAVVETQIKRFGAIQELKSFGIMVPQNFIRTRELDIAEVNVIAKNNLQFKNRLLIGATARADVITAIMMNAGNPYQVAKMADVAYSFANKVFKEVQHFNLAKLAGLY